MLIGLALSICSSGGPRVDADAAAWAAAVTSNGGTYSGGTLAAMSAFVVSAKAAGYWTKLNRVNLLCGNQLAAALVPLKVGAGTALDTAVAFVGGDYSEATGLTGNGSTKYLRTGLVPSVSLTLNDTHLAAYNRTTGAVGGGAAISALNGGNEMGLYAPYSDGNAYSCEYTTSGAGTITTAVTGANGFYVGSRTGAAAHSLYKAGNSIGSSATTGGAFPTGEFYVFATDSGGTPINFCAHALAGYSIGSGLTAGDVTAYNTHMEAFQDALGRGVQ